MRPHSSLMNVDPLIVPAFSDKLLEGRLHEFDLPMLAHSSVTASGGSPTPVGTR